MTLRFPVWAWIAVVVAFATTSTAFVPTTTTRTTTTTRRVQEKRRGRQHQQQPHQQRQHSFAVTTMNVADDFSSFEASLEEDEPAVSKKKKSTPTSSSSSSTQKRNWQDTLEDLLDPMTPVNQRQTLLTDLLSANQDIRSSVESAIRDRSIDPLLTPRGKRLQEGSRAVARQIASDILPELIPAPPNSNNNNKKRKGATKPPVPPVEELQKVGTRMFSALQTRFQSDIQAMQSDLQSNPFRSIPQRISKQSKDILKEAANVFSETPQGLQEPDYQVVSSTTDYEIRDYQAYTVASTNVAGRRWDDDDDNSSDDIHSLAQNGVAFNTLAAYVFGANKQGLSMEMTTPITTTMSGEMRFYIAPTAVAPQPPEPLEQDESTYLYDQQPGRIWIQEIPPARLAVRRFTGFCTKGEVTRQKQALLASLAMDDVELDVPHGATVPHVVFQYNPPYTIPVLRRNEIAVAVLSPTATSSAAPNGSTSTTTLARKNNNNQDKDGFITSIRDSWEPME